MVTLGLEGDVVKGGIHSFLLKDMFTTVGVMVWGAIAYGSRSPLIFIRGNMNAQRYIQEGLEPYL